MKIIQKIKNHKILKNISWILAGRITNMVLSFIVGIISARYLGPSNYGLIGYASAFATFFASLCSLGINSIIIKELIDDKKNEGEILGTSIGMRLISTALSYICIIGYSFIANQDPITRIVVIVYNLNLIFQTIDTLKSWFISKLSSKYPEISSIIAYAVVSIYKIILLATGQNVIWFAFSTSLDYALISIFLLFFYKKQGGAKLHFSKKRAKQIFRKSYHFILSGLMISIFNATDKLMLQQMTGDASVGYYTAANTIATICTFIYSAIIESINPIIMQKHSEKDPTFLTTNRKLYAIIFWTSSAAALFITVFSGFIINLLYGNEYLSALLPTCVLAWSVPFSYLGVARDTWVVCERKQKYLKYIYLGAAISNIIINAILIPSHGATGAATATLITQISTILIFPALIKELRPNVLEIFKAIILKNIVDKSKIKKTLKG